MKWHHRFFGSFLIALMLLSSASDLFAAGDVAKTASGSKVSILVKGAVCALALGAIATSYTLPHYVPSRDEITPYSAEYSQPPYSLARWDYDSAKNVRLVRGPGEEIARYIMGPLASMMDLLHRRMIHRTPLGAIKETAHEDFRYLVGYFLLYAGLRRLDKTFFHIDVDDYDAASGAKMKPNPKKVLYLSSVPEGDKLTGFPEFHFEQHYGGHPDAHFVLFTNLDDLIAKLSTLPQDSSFDRIEIFMHGNRNKVYAADKTKIRPKDLDRLLDAKLNIAAAGADIRFVSCSLARGRPFNPKSSETFIRGFGNALLPQGGQVVAASKTISVVDSYVPPQHWSDRRSVHGTLMNRSMGVMMHIMGLGNFKYLWHKFLFNLYRNYQNSMQDAIAVEIPPRDSFQFD